MPNRLRSIYNKLTGVNDIKTTSAILSSMLPTLRQLLRLELSAYEERILQAPRYSDPKNLNRYERKVFSQSGEDGMLSEIFRRIGIASSTFLEIGAGSGVQNNTTYLLFQGWSGYWIEASDESIHHIHQIFRKQVAEARLKVIRSYVTAENINQTLDELKVPRELDLMSIDIDRNTYWVWSALQRIQPRVVVTEYNGHFPPDIDWKVEYDPDATWNGTSYFGASLKAYEILGRRLGYNLVGCTLSGVNAFFVRNDLCEDKFVEPFSSEKHYQPLRLFLFGNERQPISFDGSSQWS